MIWFWLGFFALVAIALAIDLGITDKSPKDLTFKQALRKSTIWIALGLAFSGVVYVIYEYHLLGANPPTADGKVTTGVDAMVVYLSAYLLEEALSVDNIFVMSLIFRSFRIPAKYQHRVLFWGIIGAVVFRCAMLAGGVWLTQQFTWIFYFFGAYLIYSGIGLLREENEDDDHLEKSFTVRMLRRVVRVVDGDHAGKFSIIDSHGRRDGEVRLPQVRAGRPADVHRRQDDRPRPRPHPQLRVADDHRRLHHHRRGRLDHRQQARERGRRPGWWRRAADRP